MTNELQALANDPEVKPLLAVNYFRAHQRDEHAREVAAIDAVLADPQERKKVHNPGRLKQDNDRRRRNLDAQTPPPLSPALRDKVARINRLSLEDARDGMLSHEEMRHKPPGTTDRLRSWEGAKKGSILLWKRSQLLLNPASRERDLCNLERFRPSRPSSTSGMVAEAALPAVHAMTPAARENFDQVFDADWRSKETQEQFVARMKAQGITVEFKRARPLRAPKDGGKVYECRDAKCNGMIFSGPMGAARFKRHQNQVHKSELAATA